MHTEQDRDTRYYIDLDLATGTILHWDYGQRQNLEQHLQLPNHRVFITKGQYNKLVEKSREV